MAHDKWMARALTLAEQAAEQGEVPVGAVLVRDNQVLGEGFNQSITLSDPSAHAEMQAIRQAGKTVKNYRFPGATLYVTLEPCPMCAGLLVHSRIEQLVFGASDPRTGACGSVMDLAQHPALNHRYQVVSGVMEQECGEILKRFFRLRREQQKARKSC
ncbi:tRNA(adenine(34)) deaminase [Saliniradius amylolyticus]|uniref:tRNA-specific adenosine deaminase n=1 Tax=Saliniradius amylolyticus TaxID=2183582 RepID=A0A2S2E625_9ALTE|nr:tRNA adenosine(34) deaminase TadA [Saliniradius amylolyticus]AWL12690.1 tRNA(adenine(34)) deaminase [Saliniradius amylolyticus]